MIAALALAQLLTPFPFATAQPFVTPQPTPLSERALLADGVERAQALARKLGGVLGVEIDDLATGASAQANAGSAFPLASTQKLPLAVLVYDAVDRGTLQLSTSIAIDPADVTTHVSPVGDAYEAGKHAFTVRELLEPMLIESDNTAANAFYRLLGGGAAIDDALHRLRIEGIVIRTNEAGLGDDFRAGRDFAHGGDNAGTPEAFAQLLTMLQRGELLSRASRSQLLGTMAKATTYPGRLRAGFPPGTPVAHKTGTGYAFGDAVDACNDVGIATIGRRDFVVVAFLRGARGTDAQRDAVLAAVGRAAYDAAQAFPL
jgi:beta-lactamase class A